MVLMNDSTFEQKLLRGLVKYDTVEFEHSEELDEYIFQEQKNWEMYWVEIAAVMQNATWTPRGLRKSLVDAHDHTHRWFKSVIDSVLKCAAVSPNDEVLLSILEDQTDLLDHWIEAHCRYRTLEIIRPLPFPLRMQSPTVPLLRPVPQLPTPGQLAAWLGIPTPRLDWYADLKGLNRHDAEQLRHYRYCWQPKRSDPAKARLIEAPKPMLKEIQRQILSDILSCIAPHSAAHGFCPGRSVVTNATPHCGQAVVLRFDLRDFFPSIPAPRVARIFRALGYPRPTALTLAGLCTTRLPASVWDQRPNPTRDGSDHAAWVRFAHPHLPQGAPTSPALANLCAWHLDRRLAALADNLDAVYTRYADDITISGPASLGEASHRVGRCVRLICAEEGFTLNLGKSRTLRRHTRQQVTGVVVNVRPNVPRVDYDRLKAILTNCLRHGPQSQNRDSHADFKAYLSGSIAWVAMLNPIRGRKLWTLFDRIAWQPG